MDLGIESWKPFKLDELFDIWVGKDKKNEQDSDGEKVYFVENLTVNNGIEDMYTTNSDRVFSNFITVSSAGEYTGTAFYHADKAVAVARVKSLVPKKMFCLSIVMWACF